MSTFQSVAAFAFWWQHTHRSFTRKLFGGRADRRAVEVQPSCRELVAEQSLTVQPDGEQLHHRTFREADIVRQLESELRGAHHLRRLDIMMSCCHYVLMTGHPPDPTPLYALLEAQIAASIAGGEFPVGTRLPTEDNLIERFRVSRTTVRKAIQNLSDRGLIEIRRGTGTFVTLPKITQELTELTGFVEDMETLGHAPTARLIDRTVVAAGKDVSRQLALPMGTEVMRIRRVRLANGVAMSLDETYLPLEIGAKVVTHDLEAEPIFALLEQRYDIPLVEAEYRLESASADHDVAEALGVDVGSPIFLIERTSYSTGDRPVDYEKLHYRGDLIRFRTRLARRQSTGT